MFKILLIIILSIFISKNLITANNVDEEIIGTSCSKNLSNAWLDLVVVIEISEVISEFSVEAKGAEIMTLLERFNINQGNNTTHTTRIGIVVYDNDAEIIVDLNNSSKSLIMSTLMSLKKYRKFNDTGNDVGKGLKKAYNLLKEQKSFRIPAIMIHSTTYNPENNANIIANQVKQNGIQLMVITFDTVDGIFSSDLALLASPGFELMSSDNEIIEKSTEIFSQMNCKCPHDTFQFKFYDTKTDKNNVYADCLYGYSTNIEPILAHKACNPGILISVSTKEMLDLIVSTVIPAHLSNITKFTTSGNFINGNWTWLSYENKIIPFGSFPEISSRTCGTFGYFELFNEKWEFVGGDVGINNARPYICQVKACDADNICVL